MTLAIRQAQLDARRHRARNSQTVENSSSYLQELLANYTALPLFASSVLLALSHDTTVRLHRFMPIVNFVANSKYDEAAAALRQLPWAHGNKNRAEELIQRLERRAIDKRHFVG